MRVLDFADSFVSSTEPTVAGYAASAVEVIPSGNLSSDNAQDALEELQGDIDTINEDIQDILDSKGAAGGIATLDGDQKIPMSQIPAVAIVDVYTVPNIAARDALVVQEGDVAIVADNGSGVTESYIYGGSDWKDLKSDASLLAHSAQTTTHGVSGNLVGTSDAQTLTNKDIDGGTASNSRRITIPKNTKTNLDGLTRKEATVVFATDTKKAYVDDGTNLIPIGSGSGGGINFITNPDIENDAAGYAAYADAAGANPVDGTGGSPTVTVARSTSTALRGNASLIFTKDANNRQGEGFSVDFDISNADKAKVLNIDFSYIINSGTFVAGSSNLSIGDIKVMIYDKTNAVMIEPSTIFLGSNSSGIASNFNSTFQSNYNSTSYRLIIHVSSTSASAYELKFDDFSVSPSKYVYGTPITDWQSYTPVFSAAWGSVTNISFFSRRVGGDSEVKGTFTVGTRANSIATLSLPTGQVIDTTRTTIQNTTSNGGPIIGQYRSTEALANAGGNIVTATGTSVLLVYFASSDANAASHITPANGNDVTASSVNGSVEFTVPILGWTSSVQMSDNASQRVVSASAHVSSGASTTSSNPINFDTIAWDSHGCITTGVGTWRFTAPVADDYEVLTSLYFNTSSSTSSVWKNGSYYRTIGTSVTTVTGTGGTIVRLNAGDYIEIHPATTVTPTAASPATISQSNWITIMSKGSYRTISATENIAARYYVGSGASTTSANPINFDTKDFDTHGCVTPGVGSWLFRAPVQGMYQVSVGLYYGATTAGAFLYKNGALYSQIGNAVASTSSLKGTDLVMLNAGDTLQIFPTTTATPTAASPATVGQMNFITIKRCGGK